MAATAHAKTTDKAAKAPARFPFQKEIAEQIVRYGRMVVARGYIHNSLGNIAIRVPHPILHIGDRLRRGGLVPGMSVDQTLGILGVHQAIEQLIPHLPDLLRCIAKHFLDT